ncbi:hypothetical protein PENARI_c018G01873 [Penicillium arizonense]|uniref:Amidase domain-containing protein n=1 Tax=Penicillium arizonense TaxID=1835702 RepID=A0A1F5LB15_PENAI|nr:hypothetical protein PENARI_c018G01873 [Penicillium arizonense]OGE50190.1 hypothetical protein PENARI_c018G01873 [Penicillium arizonense]
MSWKAISKEAQGAVLESIPSRWRLDIEKYKSLRDVTSVPYTSGIMTKDQLEITELTAGEIVKCESREWKAVQVLEAFAARAAIAHQLVNCLTDWFFEDGLRQAREIDEALAKGGKLKGPLHGVPVALKDSHELGGHAATMGYVARKNNIAKRDSALISTLRDTGAVFFCKTTMPQSGMALETVSNLWGRTVSPFNRDLGAGGSSGGDATLVALRGSPIVPSTDMGGSIRVPAAFNGLYGIRPTSDRIPKGGMQNTNTGNLTIKLSCGPVCHSLDDLEFLTRIINAHPNNKYDVTSAPVPWRNLDSLDRKLTIGILKWDGAVMPHPPVLRALEHSKMTLEKAGHEVLTFELPFDAWDAISVFIICQGLTTLSRLWQLLESLSYQLLLICSEFSTPESTLLEKLYKYGTVEPQNEDLKEQFAETSPAVGYPHDFSIYRGYTSLFNLLDYPSVILPIPNFKVDPQLDSVDDSYRPSENNPYHKPDHELYDPELFANQPSTIQIVGRPFEDDETIRLKVFLEKWDNVAEKEAQPDGYANVEGRIWLNSLVLDIISDLAFIAPFGVLEGASEVIMIRTSDDRTMSLPVITSLTTRSEIAATVAVLPELQPYLKWIPDPFFHGGITGMNNLRSLRTVRILDRLNNPLREELTAETLTVFIAGTDTPSSTFAALMYDVIAGVLRKLRAALNSALPADNEVPLYDKVRHLSYL